MMARGPLMLLSQGTVTELLLSDPDHPRLRRHHACVNTIQDYRRDVSTTKISPSCSCSVPSPVFKKICLWYNTNVLFRFDDLQISVLGLWRIISRSPVEPSFLSLCGTKSRNFPALTQCVPSHHAIVIRQSKSALRRKSVSMSSTKRVVSILQPDSVPVLYLAENLHSSPHSSASIRSINAISFAMNRSGVEHSVLSPSSAGPNGIARAIGITAMYSDSMFLQSLRQSLSLLFHNELAQYLLSLSTKFDASRQSGCISHGHSCGSASLKWGWGRIQPDSNSHTWRINNEKMPTLNVKPFLHMPKSLQRQLICVMETATSMAQSEDHGSFSNPIRTHCFAKRFNNAMGYGSSSSLFEYIHLIISKNTVLNEHIDHKNDHRSGYNLCVVYAFYHVEDNEEYRIALVMTTRTTIGAAVEKLKRN